MDREQMIEVARRAYTQSGYDEYYWGNLLAEEQEDAIHADRPDFQRFLAALEAAGVVMVPREPTEAMTDAGAMEWLDTAIHSNPRIPAQDIYRVMLAARPK